MKALSIDPEFAWYIHDGEKTVECRTWKTNYRGPLLICASKTPVAGFISGHAVCVADLVDIVPFTEEHIEGAMMDGLPYGTNYAWLLDNVQSIIPFPVRGKMGLFDVDDDLITYQENERTEEMTDEEFELYAAKFHIAYEFPLFYSPGQHNDAYMTAMGLSGAFRANPELLYSSDPLPPELLSDEP